MKEIYRFPDCWSYSLKISFLQRVILIHSYLYYEMDDNIWSDKLYDDVAKQLQALQDEKGSAWVKQMTQYGYVFYNFESGTGFDLYRRLNKDDKQYITILADLMVKGGDK